MWYQCQECIFATNGTKSAAKHTAETGHEMSEEEE
jgi:hypothetical protein